MAKQKLKLTADLGNVNLGDNVASVGAKISRDELELIIADEIFCGRRLDISIVCLGDETEGQKRIKGMERQELSCIVDVKSYSVSPKAVKASLSFNLNLLGPEARATLGDFAKKKVKLTVIKTEELVQSEEDEAEEAAAE